jgi:hypothetical protein
MCLLLAVTISNGQSPLRQRINFNAENQRFEDVMLSLANAGQFSFSYNPSMLPVDSVISIKATNTPIKNILSTMLGDEMEVREQGNHLVILKTQFTEVPQATSDQDNQFHRISGYIQDRTTGKAIPNALIFDINSLKSDVTNDSGYYSLSIPVRHEVIGLSVISRGVVDTTIVLSNIDRKLTITLVPAMLKNGDLFNSGPELINERSIVKIVTPESTIQRNSGKNLLTHRTFQVSFIPKAGTNLKMSGVVANKYSLNVLAGYNGAVDRLEVGGLVNINRFYVHGAQIGGLANVVGQETRGFQMAGIFNTNLGSLSGFQVAGITNLGMDSINGVQLAGVANIPRGNVSGVQIAGVSNVAFEEVQGVQLAGVGNFSKSYIDNTQIAGVLNVGEDLGGGQIAGVMNVSYGRIEGFQLAGVLNAGRTVRSLQLAGVMNVAIDTLGGAQLAGVINFARKNQGFQLGLLNMGDSAEGFSLGLLSLYLKGYHTLELAYNETLPWSVRVKLGANRKFYNIIGLGTQGFNDGDVWGYTYGVGSALPLGVKKRNLITLELTATDLQDDDTWFEEWTVMGRLGVHYSQYLGKRLMLFAGPVWSNLFFDPNQVEDFPFILGIPPSQTLYEERSGDISVIGWLGFEVGLRLF